MTEIKNDIEDVVSKRNKMEMMIIYIFFLLAIVFRSVILCGASIVYMHIFHWRSTGWVATHANFQLRTFWLFVTTIIALFYMANYVGYPLVYFSILILSGIWVLIRLIKGLSLLLQERRIVNPKSWFFG